MSTTLPPILSPTPKLQPQPSFISINSPVANVSLASNPSGLYNASQGSSSSPVPSPRHNNNNNMSSSPSSPSSPITAFHSATYGDMFGATLHFWLESIVARCRCDRVSLFLPHPKHHTLVRVAMVGPTAQPVSTQNSQTALFSQRNGDTPGAAGPVTAAVLQTGVAANLSAVAQEDAADCPGTSVAKTALVVPIKPLKHTTATGANAAVGVLFAVNKMGGTQVFSTHDQYILISIAPSIAYMAETYPVDFAAHRFDPTPLHRIIAQFKNANNKKKKDGNPNIWGANNNNNNSTRSRSRGGGNNNNVGEKTMTEDDEATQANLILPERPPQLIYEQSGAEAMIPYVALALEEKSRENHNKTSYFSSAATATKKKGQNNNNSSSPTTNNNTNTTTTGGGVSTTTPEMEQARIFNQSNPTWEELANERQKQLREQSGATMSDGINSLTTAQQIVSVGEFVNRMEQCWRDAVSRTIATERELTLRNAQVVDAHSILHRKQRRLEILKDVLVETLEKNV